MKIIKLLTIKELAQNFLKAPRIIQDNHKLHLFYDYEMDSGKYSEKSILFESVKSYRYIPESDVTVSMVTNAYNAIAEVIDSDLITKQMASDGYKHYVIYFDDYGVYEIVAKNFKYDS